MQGVTHKAIGTAVGAAIVIYAIRSEQPMLALGAITAPMGAMLPDIDHDRSKLGSQRKIVIETINKLVGFVFVAVLSLAFVVGMFYGTATLLLFKEVFISLPICGICLIANSDKMRAKFKFLHKHRGIMHTLLIPVLLIIGVYVFDIDWFASLLLGLALGYLSHLYADCLTISGCPIAWPISEDCFRLGRITTGTTWEYVGAAGLTVCVLYTGYKMSDTNLAWLWVWSLPIVMAIGSMSAVRVTELFPKLKRKRGILCIPAIVFVVITLVFVHRVEFKIMISIMCIAYWLKLIKICKKK